MKQIDVTLAAIAEARPGPKWLDRYEHSWPAYREWFLSEDRLKRPGAKLARRKLSQFMPELTTVYDDLCSLVGDDELCHSFLALYNPPQAGRWLLSSRVDRFRRSALDPEL